MLASSQNEHRNKLKRRFHLNAHMSSLYESRRPAVTSSQRDANNDVVTEEAGEGRRLTVDILRSRWTLTRPVH